MKNVEELNLMWQQTYSIMQHCLVSQVLHFASCILDRHIQAVLLQAFRCTSNVWIFYMTCGCRVIQLLSCLWELVKIQH